jgi:UDP-N-acetylglucosamine:LPS N-acetylglucosamine transferase
MIDIFAQHPEVAGGFEFYIILGLLNQEMSTQFAKFPNVHIKGFLTQQEMGSLYNLCDIAITRGGTTSLAEQKLYDMKQIIIPIPRTHDQYDNAQWYVDHHEDIMINQRDKGFEINILNALIKLRTFTKKPQKKDRQLLVAQAKDAIRKAILKK